VIASSVTSPLERQFGQGPGLQQMTSTSSDGSSVITLQFSLKLNIDVAEQQVQQAINLAQPFLPKDPAEPSVIAKPIQPTPDSHARADFESAPAFQSSRLR